MKIQIRGILILTIIYCGFATQEALLAQKIHVLMVADTADARIGRYCAQDISKIKSAFHYLVPEDRYDISVLESNKTNYTQASIFKAIRNYSVKRNDTFLFMFTGHGGNSNNHHFMALPNRGRLWSYRLDDIINEKRCRFRAAITSSCNNYVNESLARGKASGWNVRRDGIAPVMEELFFNHSGFLHTNAAWPGHYGWANRDGSWFLNTMFSFIIYNPTSRPGWDNIDRMLDRRLNKKFHDAKNNTKFKFVVAPGQRHGMPITWDSPKHNSKGLRFGINAEISSRGRVYVDEVYNNTPASKFLRRGDIISEINYQKVKSVDDFVEFVGRSSREMTISYFRDGRSYSSKTKLAK